MKVCVVFTTTFTTLWPLLHHKHHQNQIPLFFVDLVGFGFVVEMGKVFLFPASFGRFLDCGITTPREESNVVVM